MNKDLTVCDTSKILVEKTESLRIKAFIPCVSDNRIQIMIVDYSNFWKNFDDIRSKAENTLSDVSAFKFKSFYDCTCDQQRKYHQKSKFAYSLLQ